MLCDQNSVTGEHTCMLLKPLDTDDIEVNGSDELGFFGPYYRGLSFSQANTYYSFSEVFKIRLWEAFNVQPI